MSSGRSYRRGGQLDLAQLRALQAVARTGSISSAANILHVTTSAVSQRLAKLEHDIGQPLLQRKGRSVRLTDAAELLVGYAERIFSVVDEAEAALESHQGSVAGRVFVAAFSTAARGLLPLETVQSGEADYRRSGGRGALTDYYAVVGDMARLDRTLLSGVTWARHNLISDASFNDFHVILCTNVLTHFSRRLHMQVQPKRVLLPR